MATTRPGLTGSVTTGTFAAKGEIAGLPAGDLTTVFTQWQAANGVYSNEQVRDILNTLYGTAQQDIMFNLARFLRERQ